MYIYIYIHTYIHVYPKTLHKHDIQNGREIFWPSRNDKNHLEKVRRNEPTMTKMLSEKNRESRNSCAVKIAGVGAGGMMTLEKVGALV